jgi:hypothetical protein
VTGEAPPTASPAYDAAATDELLLGDPLPDEDPDPEEPDPDEPLLEEDPAELSLFELPASFLASEVPEEPLAEPPSRDALEPAFALRPSERLSVL